MTRKRLTISILIPNRINPNYPFWCTLQSSYNKNNKLLKSVPSSRDGVKHMRLEDFTDELIKNKNRNLMTLAYDSSFYVQHAQVLPYNCQMITRDVEHHIRNATGEAPILNILNFEKDMLLYSDEDYFLASDSNFKPQAKSGKKLKNQ